jgi:hypothetical protein
MATLYKTNQPKQIFSFNMNYSIKEKEVCSPNNSKEKIMLCNRKTLKGRDQIFQKKTS